MSQTKFQMQQANRKPTHFAEIPIKSKTNAEGTVVIEGFANKSVIDRGGDLIPGAAWVLENFKLVPMILFNHDRDFPIGKATKLEATEDGLRIRAQLSQSDAPQMQFVRDLVKEGILKAFSVGFDPIEEEVDDKGINVIKSADLLEVSVVTLPMNQESTFNVSMKDLKNMDYNTVKCKALEDQGCKFAAKVNSAIATCEKKDAINDIIEIAEIDKKILDGVLNGKEKNVPEALLNAFAEVLGLDAEELIKLRDEKLENAEDTPASELDTDEKTDDAEPEDFDDDPASSSEDHEPDDIPAQPVKKEDEEADEEKLEGEDFQECVRGKIPKLIEDGMDQEQAVAAAMNACKEKHGEACELKTEQIGEMLQLADELKNKPEEKQAEQEGVSELTQPIQDAKTDESDTGNPHLDLAKQTNVLLGSLINEMQQMSAKLDGLAARELEMEDEEEEEFDEEDSEIENDLDLEFEDSENEEDEDDDEKWLDGYRTKLKQLENRISDLFGDD